MVRLPPLAKNDEISSHLLYVWVFAITVLFPPIWFFIEPIFIFGDGHGWYEDYKHSQELGSRIWVALSALSAFYWFHELAR